MHGYSHLRLGLMSAFDAYCSPFILVINASDLTFLSEAVPEKRGTKWTGGIFTTLDQTRAVKHLDRTRVKKLICSSYVVAIFEQIRVKHIFCVL